MALRKTKLLCGACGATGRVIKNDLPKVCAVCNGVGYSEVLHEDAQTTDRTRHAYHLGSLRRFTGVIALTIGVGLCYLMMPGVDMAILAIWFVCISLLSYIVLRRPWLAPILRMTMNFLKVVIGFVVIFGLLIGATYLLFRLRQIGGR